MNWKAGLAVIGGITIVAIPACMQANAEMEQTFAETDALLEPQKLSEQWSYRDQVDEMRGQSTRVASIRAAGWVPLSPELFVFRDKEGDPYIGIRGSLDEAAAPQMNCFDGSLNVKFDDGPIQEVKCVMGMAVGIDPKIFPQLEKSTTTWIEIETNQGGPEQFKFSTSNLKI